ncbi:MAG: NAD-dependent protein deacylase [Candidatus Lokiarchaeota archaeon]|nr:NAD-dependent protein deacylase [Candidatus Lokiarchaeota archaeon]
MFQGRDSLKLNRESIGEFTEEMIKKTADLLVNSKHAVILTGAGISTESGIPDFRSPKTGLWSMMTPSESMKMFTDHKIFWKIVREIGPKIIKAKPNKAHKIIAQLEEMKIVKALITQNIDGLHKRAGSPLPMRLHGDATEFMCVVCHGRFDAKEIIQKHKPEDDNLPPTCPQCGGQLILDVVLFGENLPRGAWIESVAQSEKSDLFIVIGSSLMVSPANQLPLYALKYGAKLIIINNSPTDLDDKAQMVLRGQIVEVMKKVYKQIKKIKN